MSIRLLDYRALKIVFLPSENLVDYLYTFGEAEEEIPFISYEAIFPKEDKILALESLDTMGILEKAFTRADQLSGGCIGFDRDVPGDWLTHRQPGTGDRSGACFARPERWFDAR